MTLSPHPLIAVITKCAAHQDFICALKRNMCERGDKMGEVKYFVKDEKMHKYPAPETCKVKHTGEKLHDEPPAGYDKCSQCFGF